MPPSERHWMHDRIAMALQCLELVAQAELAHASHVVTEATAGPLATLAQHGQLEAVVERLQRLAQHPERVDECLEIASAS